MVIEVHFRTADGHTVVVPRAELPDWADDHESIVVAEVRALKRNAPALTVFRRCVPFSAAQFCSFYNFTQENYS